MNSLPTRTLREHPDLNQLKRQAKELLEDFLAGEHNSAVAEVNTHFRGADASNFALHDAHLVLARAYGFDSWPKLKAYVDGVTAKRLREAVQSDDLDRVRAMLAVRAELANSSIDNYQILHYAVLNRSPEMTRVLMQHGADPWQGVYPHRDATNPMTIAVERGYDEILAIMQEELRRRESKRDSKNGAPGTSSPADWTPLHAAARSLNPSSVRELLAAGAEVDRRGKHGWIPLDAAASGAASWNPKNYREQFPLVASILRSQGASLTARAAVASGEAEWIRARHAEGTLPDPIDSVGGLLRIAVTYDRPEILALLLDLGYDPDERVRVPGVDQVAYSWGFPLWECAATGKHAMAEMLLERGADPNAQVYAGGTPVHQAYGQRDPKMIALLERYGGVTEPAWAGTYCLTNLAEKLLAGASDRRKIAEDLLSGGACGGDSEVVIMALEHVDWSREDARWFGILEQPLRFWNHGSGHWCHPEWDRSTYLECFRLILERSDPNIRGREPDKGQSGLTILHIVTGGRVRHVTAAEQVAFAAALLDAGARLDARDNLLKSTPLGWACRWGNVELVKLYLQRGADPVERDAEPWATPRAWAEKRNHDEILALLRPLSSS